MDNNSNYIYMLRDSLKKKIVILDKIIEENGRQRESVSGDKMDDTAFELSMDNKENLINELNVLDDGFEKVYDRIKDILITDDGKKKYESEIREMKKLISDITDKSMEIQRQEKQNEALVMKKLAEERNNISKVRSARKVAAGYYQSMNKIDYTEPQFMDQKK